MQKNFDDWNVCKKKINDMGQNKLYREREIWWCSLGVNVGFEQDGTGYEAQRPVLVLRGFSKHVCYTLPLTTSQKPNLYHFPLGLIDGQLAYAIISQMRLTDTRRFVNKIIAIDQKMFANIRKAVRDLF